MKVKSINGKKITHLAFLYDGCHKIYLVKDGKFTDEMVEKNYEPSDLYLQDQNIIQCFEDSCPLRFIQDWETFESFVGQGEIAEFELLNGRKKIVNQQK